MSAEKPKLRGNKNALGFRHTNAQKIKWRESRVGSGNTFFGRKHSLQARRKMSEAKRGKAPPNKKYFTLEEARRAKSGAVKIREQKLREFKYTGATHTLGEWELLKAQYNYTCPDCGKREPAVSLTRDHVIPISRGGSDRIENIQPLCQPCNSKKHTKIIRF